MPGPDSEQPRPTIESTTAPAEPMFNVDIAHIRDQFQRSYPKQNTEYNNNQGTKLITEALILTEQLLEKNKTEGDAAATIKKATDELSTGQDHRVAEKMGDHGNEELLTLIDTIDGRTRSDLLFALATNRNTPAVDLFLNTMTEAGKSQEQLAISANRLPELIRVCARQQLLTLIGSDYLDKLAEFERKRASAPQAMAELTAKTKPPEPTPPA